MTDPLPGWQHRTADYYPWENRMSQPLSQQVATAETPEPLVKAEVVRSLLLLAAAALHFTIPDPVLALALPGAVLAATFVVSWVLTMVARGKVWALRQGIDLNSVLDALRRV